jgi:hypothetical protein
MASTSYTIFDPTTLVKETAFDELYRRKNG